MDRLKKKELQLLKLQKQEKLNQQKTALKMLIKNQEHIQIILKYAQQYLKSNTNETLSQYSPIQISRLVFDKELSKIKQQFQKMPGQEVRIEHFIIIMLKIMNFAFEKCPLYMVGLKDMFYEIALEGKQTINYPTFFKYILGQLVTIKQEQQNTEFQVQILQRKKQDYLLHDNGIKRIYYSKDMKMIFSLDERANSVKIYDQQMKNVNRFSPKKQKHNNKFPIIIDFDFSEITQRLGIVLSDDTLSTVQLANFLNKSPSQFQSNVTNQIVFKLPQRMRRIFFIQMINKWLTVSDEGSLIYLFDLERIRSQPEKVMSRLTIDLNDQQFTQIVQVVVLSCICVVAGNEVSFYNENFTETKFKKFTHCEEIKHFKYSDQKNQFYLCGLEKNITIFSISRSGNPSKIWTFHTNKIIKDFQVFPYFDTIVIADESHDIKLMHQSTRLTYQQLNYNHIVKSKDKSISISKISKNELAIYQTYMIVMDQQKIAIERDIEYSFLPYHYYDQEKEELYISVNNQIISFSLLSGEIRKNYSIQSSNLQKHHSFFIKHKCPLFVLDKEFNIFEVYQKDQILEGQNSKYRKKLNIENVQSCFYDENMSTLIVINKNSVNQVRNDKNNNFNLINSITFQGFNNIILSNYCQKSKRITLLTSDQLIYQYKNYNHTIDNCYKFIFPKDNFSHEERFIIKFHYDVHYDIFVLFTNKSQIYFIGRQNNQQLYLNIIENMPAKLKNLKFISFNYQLILQKKGFYLPYILAYDQSGFLIQFELTKIFEENNFNINHQQLSVKTMFKQSQILTNQNIEVKQILLHQNNKIKKSYAEIGLLKAHEKQIALALKLKVEILVTLTISIDGYIRLWNSSFTMLFSLKIPTLLKITWNMKEIQSIKNKKSIDELLSIFENCYHEAAKQYQSPVQICNKSKKLKKMPQIQKINLNDPIKLQIQNKDLQEIVMQKQDYSTFYSNKQKYKTHGFFHTTSKIYPHPWRKKKQFIKIYEKAPSPTKYKEKIPQNLVQMRTSLDMTEKIKQALTYKQAEIILPQLSVYEPQRQFSERKKDQTIENQQEGEAFESCLYVKTQRKKKKINQFDEIDKQFKKKQMLFTARRWVPNKRKQRNSSVAEMKSQILGYNIEGKIDPIKAISRIFQQHNKECLDQKKGRLIQIPKIHLNRDIF